MLIGGKGKGTPQDSTSYKWAGNDPPFLYRSVHFSQHVFYLLTHFPLNTELPHVQRQCIHQIIAKILPQGNDYLLVSNMFLQPIANFEKSDEVCFLTNGNVNLPSMYHEVVNRAHTLKVIRKLEK